MNMAIPKQYILVKGTPIFVYSLRKFEESKKIDTVVIVAAEEWHEEITNWLKDEGFTFRVVLTTGGSSREHSVLNGLKALEGTAAADDVVMVHDSVRPLFPVANITDGIDACDSGYDGALPVISVKDATYRSADGEHLSEILPREELFSGQSPEIFKYGKLLAAHAKITDAQIAAIRGTAELAFRSGMKIKFIPGTESNFKLTTKEDLNAFELSF